MTFNIRFGAGSEEPEKPGYDVPSSAAKILAVAEAISSAAPDVVALQEVRDATQAGHIARLLGMKTVYSRHPAAYSLDFFEWGLAFLFRSERMSMDNPDLDNPGDDRTRRKMLAITLAGEEGNLSLLNVHFHHREIKRQADRLAAFCFGGGWPQVLMGDFNCQADDGSLAPIRSHWTDTCRAVSTESSREAEETGTLLESRARIDHIFVDLRYFTVENAGLVANEHRQASDHIPYFADIKRLSQV